jgi:hypothetical protein
MSSASKQERGEGLKRQSGGRPCADAQVTAGLASEPSAAVSVSPAECYTIRNNFAWAHLFVRHGTRAEDDGRACTWANVAVVSDYGSFGFCWTHIGSRPWQQFLAGLNFDYAMQKMMGARFRVPLSGEEARDKARAVVLDLRRTRQLSDDEARDLWNAIEDCQEAANGHEFLRDWDDASAGMVYRHELWDGLWDKVNPEAEGFWAKLWPHFIAAISAPPGTPTPPRERATAPFTAERCNSPGTPSSILKGEGQ